MLKTSPGFLLRELHQVGADEWIVILRFTDKVSMDGLLARLKASPDASFKNLGGAGRSSDDAYRFRVVASLKGSRSC
jgi:hypothetical protein